MAGSLILDLLFCFGEACILVSFLRKSVGEKLCFWDLVCLKLSLSLPSQFIDNLAQ
jgi:hypothetical protein